MPRTRIGKCKRDGGDQEEKASFPNLRSRFVKKVIGTTTRVEIEHKEQYGQASKGRQRCGCEHNIENVENSI